MKLTLDEYTLSKRILIDYAEGKVKIIALQVRQLVYQNVPALEGTIKLKPRDAITLKYDGDNIASIIHKNIEWTPKWSQLKLDEWIGSKLTKAKPR